MPDGNGQSAQSRPKQPSVFGLLKPYTALVAALAILTVAANAINLVIPKLIQSGIDSYANGSFDFGNFALIFGLLALGIVVFTFLQSITQAYLSERAAWRLRQELSAAISKQNYAFIRSASPAKLLTNFSSDIDSIKSFIANAVSSLISSVFLIIGTAALLIITDWKLALIVLLSVPAIAITFFSVFKRISQLFRRSQEAIDWLNRVISENILGAALVRILNAQEPETQKFLAANSSARDIGFDILKLFATLIPIITFIVNLATVLILALGGRFVILGGMSLGSLAAFYSYLSILVFPIIVIGFSSSLIAQATASYARIAAVTGAPVPAEGGEITGPLKGKIEIKKISLDFGGKSVLKEISFKAEPKTRTAILGPTAAGKTQLLNIMIGLVEPTAGSVEYDGQDLRRYEKRALHREVGFVFQDSIIFSLTLRENIAFSPDARDADIAKAVAAAELGDFVASLPRGLDTVVSERGTSLSGGQKQRIMLARALALNPRVLLLDDFTARLDAATEKKILDNVRREYPDITLISVTQKIASVEDYDNIILLEEGEIVASGTHNALLASSPEYMQIFESQRSTSHYEFPAK